MTYSCQQGYVKFGPETRECGGGGWSGTTPVCSMRGKMSLSPIFDYLSSGENIALGQPATQANDPRDSSSGEINMGDTWDLMLHAQALLLMGT